MSLDHVIFDQRLTVYMLKVDKPQKRVADLKDSVQIGDVFTLTVK